MYLPISKDIGERLLKEEKVNVEEIYQRYPQITSNNCMVETEEGKFNVDVIKENGSFWILTYKEQFDRLKELGLSF